MRHRLARQLRHGIKEHLHTFPNGSLVVVRALPGSPKIDVRKELDDLFPKVIKKAMATR